MNNKISVIIFLFRTYLNMKWAFSEYCAKSGALIGRWTHQGKTPSKLWQFVDYPVGVWQDLGRTRAVLLILPAIESRYCDISLGCGNDWWEEGKARLTKEDWSWRRGSWDWISPWGCLYLSVRRFHLDCYNTEHEINFPRDSHSILWPAVQWGLRTGDWGLRTEDWKLTKDWGL